MSLLGDIATSLRESIITAAAEQRGQTHLVQGPDGIARRVPIGPLNLEGMTILAVGEPVTRSERGGFTVAILPGTSERDEPRVNSPHDQWDAAIAVGVVMGEPGDGPLDEVYATISDWNSSPSLCLVDWQVAEVQQIVNTITGQGDDRQAHREAWIMVAVKYRTAAGRLTA